MNRIRSFRPWIGLLTAALLSVGLSSCGGGGGDSNGQSAATVDVPISGIATGSAGLLAASQLKIIVTGARVTGKPEVDFTVTDEADHGMTGLTAADLRFNIAKLVPGLGGGPADWQNYINRSRSGAVQGSQERTGTGYVFGTLVGKGSGAYTYTFATDITDPAANPCPAPCTSAVGTPLDVQFSPGRTHRVTVQQANSAYPEATGVLDFVPGGGAVVTARDIVATTTCNTCHNTLTAHGTRVDTKLCVTCHNPGSWVAGTAGVTNTTVDFKVMVHRIHYNNGGLALPSVIAGTPYTIGSSDFSKVGFPQDSRNCVRCHDGTVGAANATPQGDRWMTEPSIEACGSCHDKVYFGSKPDPARLYQTQAHSGGAMSDNGACASCHTAKFTDSKNIAVAHDFPARLKSAASRFEFKILGATPSTAGSVPVITFSVTDPTNSNAPYDIKTAKAFTSGAASALSVKIGWTTQDFNNNLSGQDFGQPISVNALTAAVPGNVAGTYTVTSPVAIPAGLTGTLRVFIEGHPAGGVTATTPPGGFTDRLAVKSVFKDFAVSGALVARRSVVDVAKCNVCHDTLSLHGNNRTNEIGVCVVCHNSDATDAVVRPQTAGVLTGGLDGKAEESIDFKTMIHGIHAGQTGKGGFRSKGLTIYGFGGSVNDFSSVSFPGKLNDCTSCHTGTSYQLTGVWAEPTTPTVGSPPPKGLVGTTISTGVLRADPADNLRTSPITAVCVSCHDSVQAVAHMQDTGSGGIFSATQATLVATGNENCAFCHGVGKAFEVKTMHGVK